MHSPAVSRILRFGAFEADLQARELRKQGMQIKLQEQPFQVLEFLLEHPGEIVTREQLRQKLWPADTFVDVDNSVNAAINRLREALAIPRRVRGSSKHCPAADTGSWLRSRKSRLLKAVPLLKVRSAQPLH